MIFRFRHDRHDRHTGAPIDTISATVDTTSQQATAHHMLSDYSAGLCRFTLTCSCGETFDTPYIDEALELRELHERLAPLADQLGS